MLTVNTDYAILVGAPEGILQKGHVHVMSERGQSPLQVFTDQCRDAL